MTIRTSTDAEISPPRYVARVFDTARKIERGRLDFVLPDGRRFRAEADSAGPVTELVIHDPDIFARLIREGDLGFAKPMSMAAGPRPTFRPFWT